MDASPGADAVVHRASQIMEKAVSSLQLMTKKGNQDARDWRVIITPLSGDQKLYEQ